MDDHAWWMLIVLGVVIGAIVAGLLRFVVGLSVTAAVLIGCASAGFLSVTFMNLGFRLLRSRKR